MIWRTWVRRPDTIRSSKCWGTSRSETTSRPRQSSSAWEFLGQVGLPKDRLLFTVFEGDTDVPADEEAARLWQEVASVGPERVVRMGRKDNFWSMGDTGPCGPCSEIHFYTGAGQPSTLHPDAPGWIEVWNLVFMQFDRSPSGGLAPLPKPSIDTGMGLERLASIVQGKTSNFDTDLLRPIVDLTAEIAQKAYAGSDSPDDVSIRVIADHARAAAFLIAEGILPEKREREYVLRRVMRRAIRHGQRLGIHRPFFHDATAKVVELAGPDYPELERRAELIREVTQREEEAFRATLARGEQLLEENAQWMDREGQRVLPGAVAFKLYDTYGFPLDLTEVIGREQGFSVDHAGFEGRAG